MTEIKPKNLLDSITVEFKLIRKDRLNEVYSFIALKGIHEVGILRFVIHPTENQNIIELFKVPEQFQNQGIGSLLLKSYVELVESHTLHSKICFKSQNTQEVIHKFEKFGFSIIPNADLL